MIPPKNLALNFNSKILRRTGHRFLRKFVHTCMWWYEGEGAYKTACKISLSITVKLLIKDTLKEDKPPTRTSRKYSRIPQKEDNLSTKDKMAGPESVLYFTTLYTLICMLAPSPGSQIHGIDSIPPPTSWST